MKPGPYGPFPYSPIIRRPRLEWPGGARLALWVVPNIEFFSLETRPGGLGPGKIPDIPTWAIRDYGNRVGVFRLMEVLDRYGVRATVALNSDICIHHPEIIEEGEKRRWEWMGHNQSNSRRLNEVPPEEEPKIIRDTLDTIARVSGKRPVGWLGAGLQETWSTLDLLAEAGCEYVADWGPNDDQPYTMTLGGDKTIVSLPYSYNINDKQAFESVHMTPADFQDAICRQFDTLYREGATSGRVMHIAVHPYLTGMPYRIGALDAALKYICKHKKVWKATGSEIARHYRARLKRTARRRKRNRRGGDEILIDVIPGRPRRHEACLTSARRARNPPQASPFRPGARGRIETTPWSGGEDDENTPRAPQAMLLGSALVHAAAAGAVETVVAGGVGSASANLWPIYVGSTRDCSPPKASRSISSSRKANTGTIQQLVVEAVNVSIGSGLVDPIRAINKGAPLAIVRIEAQRPPLCAARQGRASGAEGAQGQGGLGRRAPRTSPVFSSSACCSRAGSRPRMSI